MFSQFQAIGFIGAGRIAIALATAMDRAGFSITAVASKSPESAKGLAAQIAGCRAMLAPKEVVEACDLVFLTVPDDAIAAVAAALPWRGGKGAVHCSGVLSLEALNSAKEQGADIGALHPFQTFPAGLDATVWLPGSVFAVEATGELTDLLEEIVQGLGGHAVSVAARDKPLYHAAAVVSCGFIIAMLEVACDLWETIGFTRKEALEGVLPLALGTLRSVEALGTHAAATGPVMRADVGTVRKHLVALEERGSTVLPLYREASLQLVSIAVKRGSISKGQAREIGQLLLPGGTLAQSEP